MQLDTNGASFHLVYRLSQLKMGDVAVTLYPHKKSIMVSILHWTQHLTLKVVSSTLRPPIKHVHIVASRQPVYILRHLAGNCDDCCIMGGNKEVFVYLTFLKEKYCGLPAVLDITITLTTLLRNEYHPHLSWCCSSSVFTLCPVLFWLSCRYLSEPALLQ